MLVLTSGLGILTACGGADTRPTDNVHSIEPSAAMSCPSASPTATTLDAATALKAAKPLVRSSYRLPPRDQLIIVGVLSLDPQKPGLPGAAHWRRIAAKRCGEALARKSWMIASIFPDRKVVLPTTGIAFLVHSAQGWKLWYRYR